MRELCFSRLSVELLSLCILVVHSGPPSVLAGADHDHDKPAAAKAAGGEEKTAAVQPKTQVPAHDRPRELAPETNDRPNGDSCGVTPVQMSNAANGESDDYRPIVDYLANPSCASAQRGIAKAAIRFGVSFSSKAPFRLDQYKDSVLKNDFEGAKRTDAALARLAPQLLRENPVSASELFPLIGQFSLLSPKAGLSALAKAITLELYTGDQMLYLAQGKNTESVASALAKTLMQMGATESVVATELAESVEDMALQAQADSLAKIFRALAAAANVEAALVPTFNLSAVALNRGVLEGKQGLLDSERDAMLVSVFKGVQVSLAGNGSLEPGATELNEAMFALINGAPLKGTALKKFWTEAIRLLSNSTNQTALAEAVALSLTPQMTFLLSKEMGRLMQAARNYPEIAGSIQRNSIVAWNRMWEDLKEGRIRVRTFNRMKEKYFEPLVTQVLELEPDSIDSQWLNEVFRRGLVRDADIEKRFPRLVLAKLGRRDKAAKVSQGLEPTVASMAENFAVLWTLSNTHVPALLKWVKKYEQ